MQCSYNTQQKKLRVLTLKTRDKETASEHEIVFALYNQPKTNTAIQVKPNEFSMKKLEIWYPR